jgi:hypothetical protein
MCSYDVVTSLYVIRSKSCGAIGTDEAGAPSLGELWLVQEEDVVETGAGQPAQHEDQRLVAHVREPVTLLSKLNIAN